MVLVLGVSVTVVESLLPGCTRSCTVKGHLRDVFDVESVLDPKIPDVYVPRVGPTRFSPILFELYCALVILIEHFSFKK
jgi:hypothetical protein